MFSSLYWFSSSAARCINLQRAKNVVKIKQFGVSTATNIKNNVRYIFHVDPKGFELFSAFCGMSVGFAAISSLSPFYEYYSLIYVGKYFTRSLTDDIMFIASLIQFISVLGKINLLRIICLAVLFPLWGLMSLSNLLTVHSPASYVYGLISVFLFIAMFGIGEIYDAELKQSKNQQKLI